MEESFYRVILMVCPSLENWGLKPSRAILRHKMAFCGVKDFFALVHTP
jgi:hypothetical protein